ncbi:MAG TPA: pitrilysin family protein [Bacillaceae bacterium]
MPLVSEQQLAMQGYTLHVIETAKYKTNTIIWKMKAPLDEETVTYRALLPHVLQDSTKNYPTTTAFRSHLDDLYGAMLYVDLSKKGEYHVITISMEIPNEKFLRDKTPLLQKGIDLLGEVLLNPNADSNTFDQSIVDKEKRNLKQRIQSIYDDKMRYSSVRLVEEMCKGEAYALQVNGEAGQVDGITAQSLFEYYKRALNEDELDLYIIGDINASDAEKYCSKLHFNKREPAVVSGGETAKAEKVNEVKEVQDLKQGKLNMGYRTHTVYGDPDYFAMQMFNGIFGGFPHSKLFVNVREKESLAYYAASRIESHKGLLMVMSGIENKNYDKAVSIIKEQMELMKKGEFSDQELEQTKAVILNQFLEAIDTARGLVEIMYHNVVSKNKVELQDWIDKVAETTKEDIMGIAAKIELDTIYFLSGPEGEQS